MPDEYRTPLYQKIVEYKYYAGKGITKPVIIKEKVLIIPKEKIRGRSIKDSCESEIE